MAWLWVSLSQFNCLRHYERSVVEGNPIRRPGGIPSWPAFQACMRKGLIETRQGAYVPSALGMAALDAYPNPIELEEHDEQGTIPESSA